MRIKIHINKLQRLPESIDGFQKSSLGNPLKNIEWTVTNKPSTCYNIT
jgi:hypothetical protein